MSIRKKLKGVCHLIPLPVNNNTTTPNDLN